MGLTPISNRMSICHLANAWRSRSKHILQWKYYTAMKYQFQFNSSLNDIGVDPDFEGITTLSDNWRSHELFSEIQAVYDFMPVFEL